MFPKIFGKNPKKSTFLHLENTRNFTNGRFQNLTPTVVMPKQGSKFKTFKALLNKPKDNVPLKPIPAVKFSVEDSKNEALNYAWFGHSSYFLEYHSYNILVDPVFSGFASPIKGFAKAFKGTNEINTDQFEHIDLLIITHDHYDHLDYKTIKLLAPKVKKILTSIGVGSHLEFWGISPEKIIELNWWETEQIDKELNITATPTRHFSGRGLIRSKTLWSSFVLEWYGLKLFIGSDSGYDRHFKEIGDQYGPFDFAWLECGQYSRFWPQIHMIPEETVQAALDLKTTHVLPVHWGKFALSIHSWNEPILRFLEAAKDKSFKTIVPIIGSVNNLFEDPQQESWWD